MKIILGADVVPTKYTEQYFVSADMETLFGDVTKITASADRIIINLECALTNTDGAIKKFGPNIKAVPECVNAISALGVTDVALSNNHVFDFGADGLLDTMKALSGAGIPYFGIGENDTDSRKPYFIEQDGKRIGIINVCEHEFTYATKTRMGANPFDPFLTMQDIRLAKSMSDFVIVIYHGGKEHCRYPSPRLYNLCHEMVLCGADVVLTQHSHCIGCYEQFEGGHIVYGQGNFNFSYGPVEKAPTWYDSLLVELNIDKKVDISFHPIITTQTGCDLAKGERARQILSDFAKRNEQLLDGSWYEGWCEFCFAPEREGYRDAVKGVGLGKENADMLFAHYLDCEAHTDVWRELYKTWHLTEN